MVYGEEMMIIDEIKKMSIDSDLVKRLKKIGLTTYEARIYIAAVLVGIGTAEQLAMEADVPRTSAYRALEGLVKKGMLRVIEDRPTKYEAIDPKVVENGIIAEINETFDFMKTIQFALGEERPLLHATLIGGKKAVRQTIIDLITKASKSIDLVIPKIAVLKGEYLSSLNNAIKRGVKLRIMVPYGQRIPPLKSEVYKVKHVNPIGIIVDGNKIIIINASMDEAIYSENTYIVTFIDELIKNIRNGGV